MGLENQRAPALFQQKPDLAKQRSVNVLLFRDAAESVVTG